MYLVAQQIEFPRWNYHIGNENNVDVSVIGITFGIPFFLKQLVGTWPKPQCTMQRYVYKIYPISMYTLCTCISKTIWLYTTCIHLYLKMCPCKKQVNTQQRVQRGGVCTISGQRDSTMFVALLGESSWTDAESHAIDSWKGWIWEFVYTFWGGTETIS